MDTKQRKSKRSKTQDDEALELEAAKEAATATAVAEIEEAPVVDKPDISAVVADLETVMNRGGVSLPKLHKPRPRVATTTRRLVGIQIFNTIEGMLTLPAAQKSYQHGIILIGPREGQAFKAEFIRGHHFMVNPARIIMAEDEDKRKENKLPANGIMARPSVTLAYKVRVTCPQGCNQYHENGDVIMWPDEMREQEAAYIKSLKDEGKAEQAKSLWRKGPFCSTCYTPLEKTPMNSVAYLGQTSNKDREIPICSGVDDAMITTMGMAMHSNTALTIPEVIAVYARDKAPGDWIPSEMDTLSQDIQMRLEDHRDDFGRPVPYTMRPFNMAFKATNYKGSLVTFLVKLPGSTFTVGWVDEALLLENEKFGYTTRLFAPRNTYNGAFKPRQPFMV